MLIYQKTDETDKLNIMINSSEPPEDEGAADITLIKTENDVRADFSNSAPIVSAVIQGANAGEINVTTGNTSVNVQIPGWGDKLTKNTDITAGTKCKITYDAKGLVTAGADLTATDIPDLSSVYLGKTATAVNASSLGGQSPAYYTNVQSDWNQTDSAADDYIKNKPAIPAAQVNSDWNASSGVSQILNKPTFATVATSGSYNDLSNKPSIPSKDSDLSTNDRYVRFDTSSQGLSSTQKSNARTNIGAGTSSFSGSYDDLTNKPTIPTTYIQSASVSANTLTLWDQAGTTITFSPEIPDGAIAYAGGHDSVLQKVTSIPGESTVRTNEINTITNFGAVLGERNYLGYTTDDNWSTFTVDATHGSNGTAMVGGANVISQTEDALVSGYKNRTFSAHQSIIGGYKNKVYASESAVFGEKHIINGALYEADGAIKTNTRKLAVFGGENTIGVGCQWDLVAGQSITINQYGKWVFSVGAKNRMNNSNEAVNQLGWNNQTGTYITDSTQIGYDNTTGNGASNNKLFNIIQIGHSNYSNKSETYMLGYNLTTQHTSQVIAGRFNADVSSKDVLVVGCGHAADVDHGISELRENCFTAGKDGDDNKYIKVGSTTLTETQLQSLLAIINSSSSSSSGSYDHNFGGDATPEVN